MIYEVEGDILLTGAQVIAHGMAVGDPMNRGLALAIHEKYPLMHKDFHHWCHQTNPKPGSVWMWGSVGGVRIVNLLTQEGGSAHASHPSKATLSNVNHALKDLRKLIEKEQFTSLALPRLATGVGGLQWEEVLPLMHKHLADAGIPIFVYSEYCPGKLAKESAILAAK